MLGANLTGCERFPTNMNRERCFLRSIFSWLCLVCVKKNVFALVYYYYYAVTVVELCIWSMFHDHDFGQI